MTARHDRQASAPSLRFPEFSGKWEEKRLGEVAIFNPKSSYLPEKFLYIDLESVQRGHLISTVFLQRENAPSRAQRRLSNGDILFAAVRPYQRNNYLFQLDEIAVASTGFVQIRAKENVTFLFHLLHQDNFVNEVIRRSTGSNYPATKSTDLQSIKIALPHPDEQQKIATFLAAVDARIEGLRARAEALRTWKRGLLQQIFSQTLRFSRDDGTPFPPPPPVGRKEIGGCV